MTTTLAEIRARWYEQGPAELTRMQVSRDAFRLLEIVDALTAERDAEQQRITELEAALREVTRTFGNICDLTDGHDWCVTCEAIHSMAVEAFDQLRNGKPAERKL